MSALDKARAARDAWTDTGLRVPVRVDPGAHQHHDQTH